MARCRWPGVGLRFSSAQTGPKRTLFAASGCVHHFLHCLVCCPPYVRIAKVARQQLGEAMEVLAAQVAWKLAGKRLYLLELCFITAARGGKWSAVQVARLLEAASPFGDASVGAA